MNACRPLTDPVVQRIERRTAIPVVVGSNPTGVILWGCQGHLRCSLCWFVLQPLPAYHGHNRKPSGRWRQLLVQPVPMPCHPCGSTAWGCGPLPDGPVSVVCPLPCNHYMTTQIFCNTVYFMGGQVLARMVESNHEKTPVKPWRVCIGAKDNPAASAEWPV